MNALSWTCPYCNKAATLTEVNVSSDTHEFNKGNKHGTLHLNTTVLVCPNPECKEYEIHASLFDTIIKSAVNGSYAKANTLLAEWALRPKSEAKPYPAYIPAPIVADYQEACLIASDSAKASATLSRRCLQGMIRDFWKISDKNLALEINGLQGKIDSTTWQAIDAVRKVGNVGAHMESDINLIVEVQPEEARLLIGLIEFLLQDWYVRRHERNEHLQKVIALGAEKVNAKKGSQSTP